MCVELLGPMAWMTGVMNKEEYQKHRVRRGKCDAGDDVDRFGNPYWMRRHFTLVAAVVSNTLILLYNKSNTIYQIEVSSSAFSNKIFQNVLLEKKLKYFTESTETFTTTISYGPLGTIIG